MGFSASKFDSAAAAASGPSGLAAVLFVLDRVPGLRRDARAASYVDARRVPGAARGLVSPYRPCAAAARGGTSSGAVLPVLLVAL